MSLFDFSKDNPVIFALSVAVATAGALTALPVFGAVGTITTAGCLASGAIGVAAATAEELKKE